MLTLKAGRQSVTRLAFSADGAWLAAAGTGRKVYLWNLTAQQLVASTFSTTRRGSIEWLGFLPDNKVLALEDYGRYVIHDPIAHATTVADLEQDRWVGRIATNPDRSVFYGTGNDAQRWNFDGRLNEVWNFRVPDTKDDAVIGRGGVVIPADGTVVAAVSNAGDKTWLHTRDAATGKLRSKRLIADAFIRDLTLLSDGKTLAFVRESRASTAVTNAIVAGTANNGLEHVVAAPADGARLTALAAHPHGPWVAVGQSGGVVRTFDARTWTEVAAHRWGRRPVNCVVFAPDGLKAAAAFDRAGAFVVWDVDL